MPRSRIERPRKTKIGTDVAHVACDSDTDFKIKRSRANLQEAGRIVAASGKACLYALCSGGLLMSKAFR